jgi:hypothetical protein
MITALIIIGILFASFLMVILSKGMFVFGKLVADTPDLQERLGKVRTEKDKSVWHSPEQMPTHLVRAFWAIHTVGCLVVVKASWLPWVIVGCVIIMCAVFFAGLMMYNEMGLYDTMTKNARDQNDYPGSWKKHVWGVNWMRRQGWCKWA